MDPSAGPGAEPVPGTVVDRSIVPGFAPNETRTLSLPASARQLEPVGAPARHEAAYTDDTEVNPWDAARLPSDAAPEWNGSHETPAPVTHPEPSDPVPATWQREAHEPEEPEPVREAELPGRDEPLLPPAPPSPRFEEPAAESGSERNVEASVNDEPSVDDTAPRFVARTTLPTDVRLVGGPKDPLTDTQPDGIKLPDTNPDGIPVVGKPVVGKPGGKPAAALDEEEEEDDTYADEHSDERAEDPDAGEDGPETGEWPGDATPPSSKFRSGPTPPRD